MRAIERQLSLFEEENQFMTLEEMRNHEWHVAWSGGKDSTATIILMHENNVPIKEINYVRMMYDNELPATLPIMTEFVDRASIKLEEWGYKVNIIKSPKTAVDIINNVYKRSKHEERNGKKYGISNFMRGFCKFSGQKLAAVKHIDGYEMIGYAADETNRLHRLSDKKQSIMATLGVQESETFGICREYELLSPLYDLGIKRDGCWFCPNCTEREREMLKSKHPELVKKIYEMIEMCDYDISQMRKRNNWIKEYFRERNKNGRS